MLAYVAHVGPSWGLCWGYVGDKWDHLCWKTSKMPIFPSRTPPRNQNHVRTRVFFFRQRQKIDRPRLRNTAKSDVFVTSHALDKIGSFKWSIRNWVLSRANNIDGKHSNLSSIIRIKEGSPKWPSWPETQSNKVQIRKIVAVGFSA